jgi:hypothetical protein
MWFISLVAVTFDVQQYSIAFNISYSPPAIRARARSNCNRFSRIYRQIITYDRAEGRLELSPVSPLNQVPVYLKHMVHTVQSTYSYKDEPVRQRVPTILVVCNAHTKACPTFPAHCQRHRGLLPPRRHSSLVLLRVKFFSPPHHYVLLTP